MRVPTVGADSLGAALAALQTLNELWLRQRFERGRPVARLYESGVYYDPERGTEDWLTIPDLYATGYGDCEDLAAARAAELRVSGEDRGARAVAYRSGPTVWHAVVMRGDGSVEDPSLLLGMGWHGGLISPG